MDLKEIADATGNSLLAKNNVIEYIVTDSREVIKGDLFISLKGINHDGNMFLPEVKSKGGLVMSQSSCLADIYVTDSLSALLLLASHYLNKLTNLTKKIAITGSVGKTTTKEFLKSILSAKYKIHANSGNFNNALGMSLSVLSCPVDTEVIIMEMGMNHRGEISSLSSCLRPDIAVITNIGTSHIGNFDNRGAIAKAKLEIANGMSGGPIITPYEEVLLSKTKGRRSYSISNSSADFYLMQNKDGSLCIFHNGFPVCKFLFQFEEDHLKKCLAAAIGAALSAGISSHQLSQGISNISDDNTRQKIISLKNINFYTDYYNASLESMSACINHLKNHFINQRKSLVLGDILELGDYSERIHRKIGSLIHSHDFHNIFLFGDQSRYIGEEAISKGFPTERIFYNENTERPEITAMQIIHNSVPSELILVKASRAMKMERIMKQIKMLIEEDNYYGN